MSFKTASLAITGAKVQQIFETRKVFRNIFAYLMTKQD